jgi:mannitol-1-phosphate 5-dehydrogenase
MVSVAERGVDLSKAVIFGAGNIGRGFIGQLFSESGYEVCFVDIDTELVDRLNNDRAYPLHLVSHHEEERLIIEPVSAINAGNVGQVVDIMKDCSLGATAVGVRVLPHIAPLIAQGIQQRLVCDIAVPLNLIICENRQNAGEYLRSLVYQYLSEEEKEYADKLLGLVDTVIGRMVPPLPEDVRVEQPTLVRAEPYKQLPVAKNMFRGAIPDVVSMQAEENFEAFTAMKLFIHNAGHAALAYFGSLKGYEYGYEALENTVVLNDVQGVMQESSEAISKKYLINKVELDKYSQELIQRFRNKALGDTLYRLGRDPVRKLSPDDRLVGAARLVEATGNSSLFLSKAIAAGYHFHHPEDEISIEVQVLINSLGIEGAIEKISGISPDEPLGQLVLQAYRRISAE